MARISEKVRNYSRAKGTCNTERAVYEAIQRTLDTMFDIRCSTQRKWGYDWYESAYYGCYDEARKELLSKPCCIAQTVALQCIDDLESLYEQMKELERR